MKQSTPWAGRLIFFIVPESQRGSCCQDIEVRSIINLIVKCHLIRHDSSHCCHKGYGNCLLECFTLFTPRHQNNRAASGPHVSLFWLLLQIILQQQKIQSWEECFPTAYFKSNNIKKFKYWFEVALRICPMYEVFTSCHEFTKSNNLKTISFSISLFYYSSTKIKMYF